MDTYPAPPGGLESAAGTARITKIEAIPFALPYRRAPQFASGSVGSADNVLVRVHTDAGLVGQAEAQPRPYTYGESQESIVATVSGRLSEALTGVDPLRLELVAARTAVVEDNYVARGAGDLAGWDVVGQILGGEGINIAGMQVSRDTRGGPALIALTVNSAIPPLVLDDITATIGAVVGRTVDLEMT